MGNKLIIKQVNKSYDSEQAIENVLNYVVRDKDTEQEIRYWKAFGASQKNIRKACRQFIRVQELAGKDSRKRIRHMVIIFPPEVNNVAPALIAADAVALFLFRDYQVVYGVHEKKDQLHIHFAFNPVSYRTFRKWHMSHAEFENWRKDILQVVNESLRKKGYGGFNL